MLFASVPNQDADPEVVAFRERRERLWGTKELAREFLADSFSPPLADDEATQAWLADYMRNAASPRAVNVGARIASLAAPSEVLVSHTVEGLVSGSGLTFEDAGEHELKGVPGS